MMINRAKFYDCMSVGFGGGKTCLRTHARKNRTLLYICVDAMADVEGSTKLEFKKMFIVFL